LLSFRRARSSHRLADFPSATRCSRPALDGSGHGSERPFKAGNKFDDRTDVVFGSDYARQQTSLLFLRIFLRACTTFDAPNESTQPNTYFTKAVCDAIDALHDAEFFGRSGRLAAHPAPVFFLYLLERIV